MKIKIAVSQPALDHHETTCVADAMNKGAISGFFGDYIPQFENDFANFCDVQYGVTVSSGTGAIHLALAALSIGKGDEVLVSTLTNMATFFAVIYLGAIPVPIDIDADTLNLDPELLSQKITPKTKAILVVHLFGHPVDMDPVNEIAEKNGLFIIEDCAQAHGATYKGKKVGSLGDIGCFSFYANKIITTGEGGMVTTNNKKLADRVRNLKGLAFGDKNKFMHKEVGYNYRMTNIQAAVGYAQLKKIDSIISSKREISQYYIDNLEGMSFLNTPIEKDYAKSVFWMFHVVLTGSVKDMRSKIMSELMRSGIETREGFIPYNMQEIFVEKGMTKVSECPIANEVASRGFYIPSGPFLIKSDQDYVIKCLKKVLSSLK
jgi:perosamine synthetase